VSRLVLLGDGDTLDAVAELAGRLGYDAILRSDDAPDEIDEADQVVVECREPGRARALITATLAVGDPGYLGLCADEKDAMVALLKLSADRVPRVQLDRIAAPAGLPIHAATVDEKAIAIVAQLIAERRTGASARRQRD
jgi:xanthine dehydrogenase accessory factor